MPGALETLLTVCPSRGSTEATVKTVAVVWPAVKKKSKKGSRAGPSTAAAAVPAGTSVPEPSSYPTLSYDRFNNIDVSDEDDSPPPPFPCQCQLPHMGEPHVHDEEENYKRAVRPALAPCLPTAGCRQRLCHNAATQLLP